LQYRPDIDALRAVAVGAVVLSHLGVAGFTGGFSGVDIFFVISGFLITNFLLQRASAGRISLGEFYLRRARRILPMAILVLVITCVAALLLLNQLKASQVANDAYWAALFLANVHLIQQSTDYFNQGFEQSLVQHYWSLAVEEQFYVVFPLLVILVVALARKLGVSNWQRVLTWVIAVGAAGSLAWAIWQGTTEPATAYFSSLTRAYELAIGALLASLLFRRESAPSVRGSTIASVVAVLVMVGSFVALNESLSFPSYLALFPTLAAAAFIWANVANVKVPLLSKLFQSKPMVYLGKISFSIYLIHWPVIIFAQSLLPEFSNTWMVAPAVIAITIGLSAAGYKFVEQPFRRIEIPKTQRSSRQRVVMASVAVVASFGLASSAFAITGGTWNTAYVAAAPGEQAPDKYKPDASGPDASPTPSDGATATPSPTESSSASPTASPTGKPTVKPTTPPKKPAEPKLAALLSPWILKVIDGLAITQVPADLDPPISALLGQRGAQWSQCMDPADNQPTCRYGDVNAKNTAVILGDSYALAIYPMVIEALGLEDWQVIGLNRRECMISDVVPWSWDDDGADYECPKHRAWVNTYIKQLKPDLVILSDQTFHPISENNKKAEDNPAELWEDGLDSALSELTKLSNSIVYFGLPSTQQGLVDCVKSGNQLSSRCTGKTDNYALYPEIQAELSAKYGIPFINPNDWLCVGGSCPAIIDNTPVYWDGAHFTQTFAAKMAPLFRAFLIENGLL
jgi:peptidoglycan/LPS O-acetylase OafA/YrhL